MGQNSEMKVYMCHGMTPVKNDGADTDDGLTSRCWKNGVEKKRKSAVGIPALKRSTSRCLLRVDCDPSIRYGDVKRTRPLIDSPISTKSSRALSTHRLFQSWCNRVVVFENCSFLTLLN
jgi:hypothetical protein